MNAIPTPFRTYRGRPGCGCGCRGRYADSGRKVANDVRDVSKAMAEGDERVEYDDNEIVSFETDERYVWLYFATKEDARAFVDAHTPDPVPAGAVAVLV